jgi:hypothetical protein
VVVGHVGVLVAVHDGFVIVGLGQRPHLRGSRRFRGPSLFPSLASSSRRGLWRRRPVHGRDVFGSHVLRRPRGEWIMAP